MAKFSSQAEFEAALGRWPRRLLHVPTMTSYCWQPGNVYGTSTSPRYNTITYTWGRWKLRTPDKLPHVRAVDIKGVEWEIPRVDPQHFSREDFLAVIQRAVQPVPSYADRERTAPERRPGRSSSQKTEFLWLDVACIDQRPTSPDMAAEVGRQADIFRGAHHAFVWLTTFSGSELVEVLTNISIPGGLVADARLPRPLTIIQDNLECLCSDPWFSSLWTLQEAFLRQDALFLSRDGLVAGDTQRPAEDGLHFAFCFRILMWICRDLVRFINADVWNESTDTTVQASDRHQALMSRIGVNGLQSRNPLAAFVASGQRTTSKEPDRVYGIQQIFGFRLGATAVDAPQRAFTRQELEVQLAQEILARFPIMSQLFVALRPVEFGHGWKISTNSMIYSGVLDPEWSQAEFEDADLIDFEWLVDDQEKSEKYRETMLRNRNPELKPTPLCTLSTETVDDHTWGHFQGKTIPFASLLRCAEALTSELGANAKLHQDEPSQKTEEKKKEEEEEEEPISIIIMELDKSDYTTGWPNGWKGEDDWVDEVEGCKWLADQYPHEDLIVLGLASFSIRAFGLILLRDDHHHACSELRGPGNRAYWRRLGYCEWWMTNTLDDLEMRPGSSFAPGVIDALERNMVLVSGPRVMTGQKAKGYSGNARKLCNEDTTYNPNCSIEKMELIGTSHLSCQCYCTYLQACLCTY